MKKISLLLAILVLIIAMPTVVSAAEPIKFIVQTFDENTDADYLTVSAQPIERNGRLLVPIRDITDRLGYKTSWNPSDKKVTITNSNTKIEMTLGSLTAWVNNKSVSLDVAPTISNGRTMVPLRFIAEATGYSVSYVKSYFITYAAVYIAPFNIFADAEKDTDDKYNESNEYENPFFPNLYLKKGMQTVSGIKLGDSIQKVIDTYSIPVSPEWTRNYPSNYTGTIMYWGPFYPYGSGSSWTFEFQDGSLISLCKQKHQSWHDVKPLHNIQKLTE